MIDYTHPDREPATGTTLRSALRAARRHTDRLAIPSERDADPVETVIGWFDAVGAVGDACARCAARQETPSPDEFGALEEWLARTTGCLAPWRRLLRSVRCIAEPPWTDDETRDQYLGLLGGLHVVHEQTDRWRTALASRRDGLPPEGLTERFVSGRTAHQDVARRALRVLPHGDARRDQWLAVYAFLTQRLTEYGGDGPGEAEASRDLARELALPGSRLDDDLRAQMRAVEAALATHVNTGGDPARATDAADLVRLHREVWLSHPDDPLTAARYGAELLRALLVGESVDGLGPRDAEAALDTAVRAMDPKSPEWPEVLAVRALVRTYAIGSFTARDRRTDALVHELDAVRALLPAGHSWTPHLVVALAQLLSARGTGDGTLADVRSALALLRRARAERVPDPLQRLVIDTVFAQVHVAFHFHAGADDADCTGTADDSPPPEHRAEHGAHTHRLLRQCVVRARELDAERQDHGPEILAMVMHNLGWSLMMAAAHPDGPGAGSLRGNARHALVSEAVPVLGDAVDRTDPRSPQRALRELLLHLAGFVVAQRAPVDGTAAGRHAAALAELADRPDVRARPELRTLLLSLHAYAESLRTAGPGVPLVADRSGTLRRLEAAVAADPSALHASAVDIRMQLARSYRRGGVPVTGSALEELVVRTVGGAAAPAGAGSQRTEAEAARSRALGLEALGLLARRALVQEATADAILVADRAGLLSREVAAWCVADGVPEEAVRALEGGRALTLHTEMASSDVRRQLAGLGRRDLAEQWAAWRRGGGTPAAGGPEGPAGPAGRWDPFREHPLPARLGAEVLAVLERDGAVERLTGAVPVTEIAAALRSTGDDALVYLIPAQGTSSTPGGVLRVGTDARVRWTALPGLGDSGPLDSYLGALELSLSAPRSEVADHAWRSRLAEVCEWAGRTVVDPLLRELPAGSGPAGVPRLVLVPLGELAAVPWNAAVLPGGPAARPRRAIDRLVLSTAPSARMFTAAARRPAVRAGDAALLVLGLTGEQARASSSRMLHRLYPDARVLAPGGAGGVSGDTVRPEAVLEEIARACGHGVVDISAHLLPDPADSWRSHLAFGTGELPDGGTDRPAARLSVRTIAAERFPVPPGGPGLCVSLASCMNSLPRRQYDESFTMSAAFLAGGASSVLGSLWLVRLHATALVDLLFHHWLRAGERPVDALRRAQLWMTDPGRTLPEDLPDGARGPAAELLEALAATGHDPADPALWAGLVIAGR